MSQASKKIEQLINDNAVIVFSKSYCPYCTRTKSTLTNLGTKFETLELDQTPDGGALQDAIEELTGQRSVPNTFISQKSIGGNDDLQRLHKAGKLEPLLAGATALTA